MKKSFIILLSLAGLLSANANFDLNKCIVAYNNVNSNLDKVIEVNKKIRKNNKQEDKNQNKQKDLDNEFNINYAHMKTSIDLLNKACLNRR